MNNLSVIRGGSWYNEPEFVCSAYRDWTNTGLRSDDQGFRLTVTTYSTRRMLRGGSWSFNQANARAAARDGDYVDSRYLDFGFRLVFKS